MTKYHHGNLRNTLLTIAVELLAEDGVHALSMRKMAQRAGVSHNAPYMHFRDKDAVLAAIAEEGFILLAIEVESAISKADKSARQQLIAASETYVRFALDRADRLQVMFRPIEVEKYPKLLEVSQASLNRLFEIVKAGQEKGELRSGDPHEMTKAIWTMVHGIAALSIAYKTLLLPEKNSVEDVVITLMNYLLDGLAA